MSPVHIGGRLLTCGLSLLALVLVLVGCQEAETQRAPDQAGSVAKQAAKPAEVDLGYTLAKDAPTLAEADIQKILDQAEAGAQKEISLLRVDKAGTMISTRMHIIVVNRTGKIVGRRSMQDAWAGSVSIAKAKAFTAMAFSSDQNALTTRTIGALSQPNGPLWQIGNSNRANGIIEFPGGVPLYKNGRLVGAIGVSGDGVDQDESVAAAGVKGFEPPEGLRVDTVLKGAAPYLKK
jgi:uncharacterized protein GlcG (DUF336 family)